MSYVVDASAVVALLRNEPGAERVEELLESAAFISTVNLSEVQKSLGLDLPAALIGEPDSVITPTDFTATHAKQAAALFDLTKRAGLSLADRACLALAISMDLPVLTADRAWAKLKVGVEVELVR